MREQIYGTLSPVKVSPPIYRALQRKWCNHSIPSSLETKWSCLFRKMTYSDVICRDSGISREVKNPLSNKPHWRSLTLTLTLHPTTPLFFQKSSSLSRETVKNESAKHFLTIITFICQIISLCFKEIARLQNTDSTTTVHVQ